jgi:hypothetical protein
MMDILIGISDAIQAGLQEFLSNRLPGDRIRGAILEVDRYWLDSHNLVWSMRYDRWDHFWHWNNSKEWRQIMRSRGLRYEPDWRPSDWGEHCKHVGYPPDANPFVIRIVLRRPEYLATAELPQAYQNYPVVYEYRPPCRGISHALIERPLSVGCAFPRGTAGTLGGILRCPITNKQYAVGCAHVLGESHNKIYSPGPYEGRGLREIGEVKHSIFPGPKTPGLPCHPDHNAEATKLDVSIAELWDYADSVRSLGWIPEPTSVRSTRDICQNDAVIIAGKVSGTINASIGGCGIWYEIEFDDGAVQAGPRCFGRLFELKPARRQYVREEIARPGDSGAPVLNLSGTGYSWDGILMASDGPQAFACFVQYLMEATEGVPAFPSGLRLAI